MPQTAAHTAVKEAATRLVESLSIESWRARYLLPAPAAKRALDDYRYYCHVKLRYFSCAFLRIESISPEASRFVREHHFRPDAYRRHSNASAFKADITIILTLLFRHAQLLDMSGCYCHTVHTPQNTMRVTS